MTELCTAVSFPKVQINIVPFGTFQLIDTHFCECSEIAESDEEKFTFKFPTDSVISGSIIYEQQTLSPKPL